MVGGVGGVVVGKVFFFWLWAHFFASCASQRKIKLILRNAFFYP